MEAHLVHYNEKYGNKKTAITRKDGIAVVAFLFQINRDDRNAEFSAISDHISQIRNPRTKYNINPSSNRCIK